MTAQQISENISAVVSHMITVIPGGWPNISGLYVTTTKTTSIPLYASTTSADKVELPPDVKIEKRLIASGDPGLIGGDDDDEDEGEGMIHVFDDGSIKIKGVDDDDEDEENQVSRRKRKKKNQDTKPATAPTPTTVNGETTTTTSSDPAKKKRKKKSKKGKTNIVKTDDQVQPTEQQKSDEAKTPIEVEAVGAAKKKKSPAKTNGNAPAVNNIKTEKVASTKGPLSKKPRLK